MSALVGAGGGAILRSLYPHHHGEVAQEEEHLSNREVYAGIEASLLHHLRNS